METTIRSPGRRAAATRAASRSAVAADRSGTRLIPARPFAAAQARGMPLVTAPTAKTSTRRPSPISRIAGAAAASPSRPAPAVFNPAPRRVARVSSSPGYPQSRTWLLASAQQSMPAAVRQGTLSGCIR